MITAQKLTKPEEWENLLTHYHRKGLLSLDELIEGLRSFLNKEWINRRNPFTSELQKTICFNALQKRITLYHDCIDKVYEDITLLFNSESRSDGEGEGIDQNYFDNLLLICSQPNYHIDIYRKSIYRIRHHLEEIQKGEWCLKQVLPILIEYLKLKQEET